MLQLIQRRLQLFYPVQHKNQHFHIPGLTPSDSLSLFLFISIALCRTKKKGCGAYRRKNSAPQVKFLYAARLFFDAVSYLI